MEKSPAFRRTEKMLYEYKTYVLAIKNLTEDLKKNSSEEVRTRLEDKTKNKTRIEEALLLFNSEELIIWQQRYIKDLDINVLIDNYGWSRTTYFRLRKGLVLKVMKCLGDI